MKWLFFLVSSEPRESSNIQFELPNTNFKLCCGMWIWKQYITQILTRNLEFEIVIVQLLSYKFNRNYSSKVCKQHMLPEDATYNQFCCCIFCDSIPLAFFCRTSWRSFALVSPVLCFQTKLLLEDPFQCRGKHVLNRL